MNKAINFQLALCLLVSSAGKHCKQFGPRSGPTKLQIVWTQIRPDILSFVVPDLVDTLKFFSEKVDFKKKQQKKKHEKLAIRQIRQRVNIGPAWPRGYKT